MNKAAAFEFFRGLESFLNANMPDPQDLKKEISLIVAASKSSNKAPHKKRPEEAFLNHYIVPLLHDFVASQPGMDKEKATQAMLSENYRHLDGFARDSPRRSHPHPFRKDVGLTAKDIVQQWKGNTRYSPAVQACPDVALRDPSPCRVVIEGKYFSQGSFEKAEKELATGIYEVFFYLGLPRLAETNKHPAWDYDYALLLAYDATDEGNLQRAWELLDEQVKWACWDGGNIYVMIFRGKC